MGHNSSECKTKIFNPTEKIVKAIFGWDYNSCCRCHYYREFGHIGMNCVKHHVRRKDTTISCYTCTELGHIAKNYMNIGRIMDERKEKEDNIKKNMRHQWIPKSTENASSSNDGHVTQEVGDCTIFN